MDPFLSRGSFLNAVAIILVGLQKFVEARRLGSAGSRRNEQLRKLNSPMRDACVRHTQRHPKRRDGTV